MCVSECLSWPPMSDGDEMDGGGADWNEKRVFEDDVV